MWGPGAQGGFQNALAMGLQVGQMVRQGQDQREYKNALATVFGGGAPTAQPAPMGGTGTPGIVATPEQEAESEAARQRFQNAPQYADDGRSSALAVIARQNPQLYMQMQQREAAQASARIEAEREAKKERRADLPTVTRLLETSVDQESYTRNLGMAQQYGIDVSTLPQQFDPAWRDQQIGTMKMLQTPEGQEVLSTAGKQAFDEGFKPGTPEFQKRANEIWQQSGAIPYTGENGETRLYVPGRGVPTQQAITEGTMIENDAGEKMILRNGKWEAVKGGTDGNVGGSF